ncbi:hypothetical protein [Marinivivus vitaminiproducens]|uniref:hypothetical protein n=1 Tax=Marinivivus vitaminiproducens TaxID=3035935 RepID=UPI0027A2365C|nr:hypothetical protein P4R82_04670 [Geminicoccaceae bacterium SCSIO 64248]
MPKNAFALSRRDMLAPTEYLRALTLASEMSVAAATTIALRLNRMWLGMASPATWTDPEWGLMVTEKMKAGAAVNAAMTQAMLSAVAAGSWDALRLAQTTSRTLRPLHRAATANARRLSGLD